MLREDCSIPALKPQDALRFWEKVRIRSPKECWPWTATKTAFDAGGFSIGDYMYGASRVAWTIAYGPIPLGMLVLHHCDNPSCVNLHFVSLGTSTLVLLPITPETETAGADK